MEEYNQREARKLKGGCKETCKYDCDICRENFSKGCKSFFAKCCDDPPIVEPELRQVLTMTEERLVEDKKYYLKRHRLLFYSFCGRLPHILAHFAAVGIGLGFGWFSVIKRYAVEDYSRHGTVDLTFTIISMICCIAFVVSGFFEVYPFHHNERGIKRLILYFEFLGLFFYMMALLYVSVVAGNLIYGDPCELSPMP